MDRDVERVMTEGILRMVTERRSSAWIKRFANPTADTK